MQLLMEQDKHGATTLDQIEDCLQSELDQTVYNLEPEFQRLTKAIEEANKARDPNWIELA